MFGAFDDQGRLYITESGGGDLYQELLTQQRTCRVSMLEDRDGDGKFENIRVFAEPFVPSMGIVWREGKLYVADPPDLVALEDTDGDGKADRRTVILSGFGHTDNGSLHGLIFGPDGWLYMTMGWPDGYRVTGPDGKRIEGKTGALIRCRSDGSDLQVLARGFDQLIELGFLPGGEIIGSQTWYRNPSGGLRDSLTHLLLGGHYPQRWQDEPERMFVSGEVLPPILMLPAVAHSGIAVYRGNRFQPEWRGQIISAQFNTRAVVRHPLIREGASFRSESQDLVITDDPDFRPADVLEDADGSLLILDTGSWYVQHCPTGRMRPTAAPGAIYRFRRSGAQKLVDPRGLKLNWASSSIDELALRLKDPRPAIRERAMEFLVSRGEEAATALLAMVKRSPASSSTNKSEQRFLAEEARLSAIWILGRSSGESSLKALRNLVQEALSSASPEESKWSDEALSILAKSLALRSDQRSAPALERMLSHPSASVRLAAAEALNVCGRRGSSSALVKALAEGPDRMLEHALISALHKVAGLEELRAALTRPEPALQKAALLILNQAPHRAIQFDEVFGRLTSTNGPLRWAAEYCLQTHPEWGERALAYVAKEIRNETSGLNDGERLVQLLRPFQSAPRLGAVISEALTEDDSRVSPARKAALLRFVAEIRPETWGVEWAKVLEHALNHPSPDVCRWAVEAAANSGNAASDLALWRVWSRRQVDPEIRLEALSALAQREPSLKPEAFQFLEEQLAQTNSALARVRAAEIFSLCKAPDKSLGVLVIAAQADAAISPSLVLAASKRSGYPASLVDRLLDYLGASVERGWPMAEEQLDSMLKTASATDKAKAEKIRAALQNQAEQQRQLLREYHPLLTGGNSVRGREVFFGKGSCFTCHTVVDQGRPVGPDLTKVGAIRTGLDILESVLLPSATFAQGYETYSAETAEGESVTGSLGREGGDYLVLRAGSGAEVRLRRSEVKSLTKSPVSMMPEGLLQGLSRSEAADLLAFLQELK